ncbi:MAG: hypothetical protein DRJ51_04335 [Thermoprotei archaeon]|nr:MAG: hypothetical protein DRJ36_01950 [Thermoprotei archaeon]RLE81194.1 MAG: hypothetical protein DRJ51_04335 [Thermoprotei archaeon]
MVRVKVKVETGILEHIEFILEHDGVYYYRIVKLVRLLRNPREYAQIETALEIHRDFVSSTRELPNARLVLLACNSKKYGLLWCYGVAVTALNEDEALVLAEDCFDALVVSLKGTYRQTVFRLLTGEKAQEILCPMQSGNGLAILGISEPRDSSLDHREAKRFVTRLPIGWSIVRKMRTFNLIDTEPVLVKWDFMDVKPPERLGRPEASIQIIHVLLPT